jgi:hypothetical protein
VESLILREQQNLAGQSDEFLLPVRPSGIENLGNVPMMIGTRRDDIAIHRPMVVLAKREAVGGVVVLTLRKGDEVGGVDEGDVVAGRELDAEAAGGALVIVDGEDLAAEGGRAAVFEGLVCDEEIGLTIDDFRLLIFDWKRRAQRGGSGKWEVGSGKWEVGSGKCRVRSAE